MAVDVKVGSTFEVGTPTELFQTQISGFGSPNRYAPSADGQKFLVNSIAQQSSQTPITVITNWTSTIKK